MTAMPLMVGVLCAMAIAYRYYSAFLAARVAALDDARQTPAVRLDDGQNYQPTNKWVLFGHHFAAISGAGPLVGPVLAAQFGYLPGLLWIVIGVCLAGAAQDFLALAASLRRNGRSLAQIASQDIGPVAGTTSAVAILFIIVIALAGLGKVVVNALGGDTVKYPPGSQLLLPPDAQPPAPNADGTYTIPSGATLRWPGGTMAFTDAFKLKLQEPGNPGAGAHATAPLVFKNNLAAYPAGAVRLVPGSSWGTFTIACTIPIALFVGLYMHKLRKGHVVEASLIGGGLTLAATFVGGWVHHHPTLGPMFNLSAQNVILAMAIYGFVAAVLPVWVLLVPRDYISSFLKIGTIAVLVGGVIVANPKLEAPPYNHVFAHGGPVLTGNVFPFLFISIMCGAISGFHALVSTGTTPKMVRRETDARMIGYGAMLIEGLVGVVALIAATTLPVGDYYGMNTALADEPRFHDRIVQVGGGIEHLNLYEQRTQETLRGRASGAVTLAVGMAHVFDRAAARFMASSQSTLEALWKYWYHFAIMFEALFILTTIDAGTRIGRFLLQEMAGKIHPRFGQTDWWPGAIISTALIVLGWAYFINANEMKVIWPMFGIANQMLAVIALAVISAYLANERRARFLWVTVLPMLFVATTTFTAGAEMLHTQLDGLVNQWHNAPGARNSALITQASVLGGLILFMLACGTIVLLAAARRVWSVINAGTPPVAPTPAASPLH